MQTSNPPPVITLYRQRLKEQDKKDYAKYWSQEPPEVKEFFSTIFQALKYAKQDYSAIMNCELETNDHSIFINDVSAISMQFENSCDSFLSINDLLHSFNGVDQSAFYRNNSILQISKICEKLKEISIEDKLTQKLNSSFKVMSERTKHQ